MKTKRCGGACKQIKPISDFARKGNYYQYQCRSCQAIYRAIHYRLNRNKIRKQIADRRAEVTLKVRQYKEARPCSDCKQFFQHPAMDFDHPTEDKEASISWMMRNGYSWESIQKEIAKCELVCSNCHRIRGFDRSQVTVLLTA